MKLNPLIYILLLIQATADKNLYLVYSKRRCHGAKPAALLTNLRAGYLQISGSFLAFSAMQGSLHTGPTAKIGGTDASVLTVPIASPGRRRPHVRAVSSPRIWHSCSLELNDAHIRFACQKSHTHTHTHTHTHAYTHLFLSQRYLSNHILGTDEMLSASSVLFTIENSVSALKYVCILSLPDKPQQEAACLRALSKKH